MTLLVTWGATVVTSDDGQRANETLHRMKTVFETHS
jgi:hypothetical protein